MLFFNRVMITRGKLQKVVLFEKGKFIYILSTVLANEPEVFDQILSTFKFTDQKQADGTENWKTYTNDQYGFSIKYPAESILKENLNDLYLLQVIFDNIKDSFSVEVVKGENGKVSNSHIDYRKWQVVGHIADRIDQELKSLRQGREEVKLLYTITGSGKSIQRAIDIIGGDKYSYVVTSNADQIDQILSTFKFVN